MIDWKNKYREPGKTPTKETRLNAIKDLELALKQPESYPDEHKVIKKSLAKKQRQIKKLTQQESK